MSVSLFIEYSRLAVPLQYTCPQWQCFYTSDHLLISLAKNPYQIPPTPIYFPVVDPFIYPDLLRRLAMTSHAESAQITVGATNFYDAESGTLPWTHTNATSATCPSFVFALVLSLFHDRTNNKVFLLSLWMKRLLRC